MKNALLFLAAALLLCATAEWTRIYTRDSRPPGTGSPYAGHKRPRPASGQTEEQWHRSMVRAVRVRHQEYQDKHPDLAPEYRNVPDERNGYLHFIQLAKDHQTAMPLDLQMMLSGQTGWDRTAMEEWAEANRALAERILRVAELPDRSASGIDSSEFSKCRLSGELGTILCAYSKLAWDSGNTEEALRLMRGVTNLGRHVAGIEDPSFLHGVVAASYRTTANHLFVQHVLPGLQGDPIALMAWRDALKSDTTPAEELGRMLIGEWNFRLQNDLIPRQLGYQSSPEEVFPVSDPDELVASQADLTRSLAADLRKADPGRLHLSAKAWEPAKNELSNVSAREMDSMRSMHKNLLDAFAVTETRFSLRDAAIAISLGQEPPADPVSGLPFVWNPETRTLSAPQPDSGVEPVKVP